MLLFFIRHGDPIYNPDSLTEQGQKQANALAKRLALYGLDKIYTSTSNRAMLTAKPTCHSLNLEAIPLEWCHETLAHRDFSIQTENGRRNWCFSDPKMRLVLSSKEVASLGDRWWTHPAFADTNIHAGYERICREAYTFLGEQGYRFDANAGVYYSEHENTQRIALFAHQGFGLAFLSCVLNIPYPTFCTRFDMGHTGMTVIEFSCQPGWCVPTVLTLSDDAHLYKEGLATKYQNRIAF